MLELAPDIVITDIRMPQADGLEMIRRLKAAGCKSKFIVLSGYAEFEYARKGIELGVKFYINKPVEEEELEECVTKVIAEIEGERAQSRQWSEYVLRDMLDNGYDVNVHGSEVQQLRWLVPGGFYACLLLEPDRESEGMREDRAESQLTRVEQIFRHYGRVQAIRYAGNRLAVLVMEGKEMNEAALVRTVRKLQEAVSEEWGCPVSAGIGRAYPILGGIGRSFEEAQQALRYRVIKGAEAVIAYGDIERLASGTKSVTEEDIGSLEKCIDEMDAAGSAAVIGRIFRSIESESALSLEALQQICSMILLAGMMRMPYMQLGDFDGRQLLTLEGIARCRTMEELKAGVTRTIDGIISQKLRSIPRKKDVIAEIKEYVAAHYAGNITLADLSARFFLNPYYLSQLFKEKTGDTYLSYLVGVRMAKAKELLEETDLKVYEICQTVGYSDTNHFSKLFEKQNGCTPSEYRKKCKP